MQRMTVEQFQILRIGQELCQKGHLTIVEAHKIHSIVPRIEAGELVSDEEIALMAKVNLALFAA